MRVPHRTIGVLASARIAELRICHDEIIRLMDEVDALIRSPDLDLARLSRSRMQLSQARRLARQLVDAMIAQFPAEEVMERALEIERVRTAARDAMLHTAAHNSGWNYSAAARDPAGYWTATREIRRKWMRSIECEKQLFYGDDGATLAA